MDNLKNKRSDYYVNNNCSDFTPFLFVPYYQNYQSWRDNGLESVNNLLDNEKNAIMISLDLKEYFYRSLIDFEALNKDLLDTRKYINGKFNYSNESNGADKINLKIDLALTRFIEKVFRGYSDKFDRSYTSKSIEMAASKKWMYQVKCHSRAPTRESLLQERLPDQVRQ